MAYSIMVWLVNPGENPQEQGETLRATEGRGNAPGAETGVNIGPPIPRMVYGVYEEQQEAMSALSEVSTNLQENRPLRINARGSSRIFLLPASRVHYVSCDEVQRPGD